MSNNFFHNIQPAQQLQDQRQQLWIPSLVLQHSKSRLILKFKNCSEFTETSHWKFHMYYRNQHHKISVDIKPVEMPQLRMQTLSKGANGLILARQPE